MHMLWSEHGQGEERSAEVIGMTADDMKRAKCLTERDVPCLSHALAHFILLIGSTIEVTLFPAGRRHDFMISTLVAENSLSFPIQPRDLARGHLMCAEPKPLCQRPVLVPHKELDGS